MATCKDCIHCEACKSIFETVGYTVNGECMVEGAEKRCDQFTDKSRFIELPYAVNSRVAVIRSATSDNRNLYITDEVIDHYRTFSGCTMMCFDSHRLAIPNYQWDNVFLTKEEAEAAIAERGKV